MKKPAALMLLGGASLLAATANAEVYQTYDFAPQGQFTVANATAYYWDGTDYKTHDLGSGAETTIGHPDGGVLSNGFGDAFGVYDKTTQNFYVGTYYKFGEGHIYTYKNGAWQPGSLQVVNAYGGAAYGGSLYLSGLSQPWGGGGGNNFIYRIGDSGSTHTLIQTGGNSAPVTIASTTGDLYAGGTDGNLYRWTAESLATVDNNDDESFLTLDDADVLLSFGGQGNGVAIDAAGNVFFAANDYLSGTAYIAMLDATAEGGYRVLFDQDDFADLFGESASPWLGNLTIDGDYASGDALYFSSYGVPVISITVPEPTTTALLGALAALLLLGGRRLRRRA